MNVLARELVYRDLSAQDERLLAEIASWLPVLRRLGIHGPLMGSIARRARGNGTTFKAELLLDGLIGEEKLYRALAAEAGLPFLATIDPELLVVRNEDCLAELKRNDLRVLARLSGIANAATLVMAPQERDLARFLMLKHENERVRSRICVTTPTALRAALMRRAQDELTRQATNGLFESAPKYSAKLTLSGWQAFFIGAISVAVPLLAWFNPLWAFLALHVAGIFFFFCCSGARFLAARNRVDRTNLPAATRRRERPVYSVLVALYREAEVVPRLLVALSRLQWPRHRLEIKLVCEADDRETLEAIRAHKLRACVEIIEVPASLPRTKPKALRYALPLTRGEFVALYDAEDQPHPLQLEEAWQRFCARGDELACVQAPLDITNGKSSTLAGLFAFEYAALFHGLLPWLAKVNRLLPLGGTSNHFRRGALLEVGAWDAHNVAEDADLGVRLARFGYASETISLPTKEQAPEDFATWRPQRSRWFKGWAQAWLVHMRDPVSLFDDLGPRAFAVMQLMIGGMLASSLLHPVIFLTAIAYAVKLFSGDPMHRWQVALFIVDVLNLSFSYGVFLYLGWRNIRPTERPRFWKLAAWTPLYWMMLSHAAWCAMWELIRTPHQWNKTPHKAE
jgi:cellulose synthase/poly-beta-1,6-N-acetylglucosamine synthase-like glycosyltransferase